jgi:hypothetical protein
MTRCLKIKVLLKAEDRLEYAAVGVDLTRFSNEMIERATRSGSMKGF